jgi:hypothetical protein
VLLAFQGFLLPQGEQWRMIGLDLDGVTTTRPELAQSCAPNPSAPGAAEDGDDGRDNRFGSDILPVLLVGAPEWTNEVADSEVRGLGALLVRIRGYNGRGDDPAVSVALMHGVLGTPGLPGVLPPEIAVPPDGLSVFALDAPPPPRWDGGDFFWVDERDFFDADGERPRWADPNAYVAHGVIVAQIATLPLRLPGRESEASLPMIEALVLIELPEDPSAAVAATIAGRLPVTETAAALLACSGAVELERHLDLAADIHAAAGRDPETRCDAVSAGIRVSGGIAGWGGIAPRAAPVECF